MNIKSLLNTKAPVIAIPVEGKAPVCVDGKRLRAWAKKVTVQSITVEVGGGEWYPVEILPKGLGMGPVDMCARRTVETRSLSIAGHAGRVKTRCNMIAIDRRVAIKELSAWSAKERERHIKRIMLGARSKDQKKELKLAKYEGEAVSVSIPELPLLSFVVRCKDDIFTVTEVASGKVAGVGATAEAAILEARKQASTLSAEQILKLQVECLVTAGSEREQQKESSRIAS